MSRINSSEFHHDDQVEASAPPIQTLKKNAALLAVMGVFGSFAKTVDAAMTEMGQVLSPSLDVSLPLPLVPKGDEDFTAPGLSVGDDAL